MDGTPIRFRVILDGLPPRENAGVDTAPDGTGVVRETRLYQLIRQKGPIFQTVTIRQGFTTHRQAL